ncbi:MAG: hypothetical protein ACREDT_03370 [Methylocella sp.]
MTGRAGVTGAAPRRARLRPFGLDPAAIRQAAIASCEPLLALAREHWAIENKLHYARDVSLSEDRCRVRAGARALACSETSSSQSSAEPSVPEARENFREDRQAAIAAVTARFL